MMTNPPRFNFLHGKPYNMVHFDWNSLWNFILQILHVKKQLNTIVLDTYFYIIFLSDYKGTLI